MLAEIGLSEYRALGAPLEKIVLALPWSARSYPHNTDSIATQKDTERDRGMIFRVCRIIRPRWQVRVCLLLRGRPSRVCVQPAVQPIRRRRAHMELCTRLRPSVSLPSSCRPNHSDGRVSRCLCSDECELYPDECRKLPYEISYQEIQTLLRTSPTGWHITQSAFSGIIVDKLRLLQS